MTATSLAVPPHERNIAENVLTTLGRVRFVSLPSLMAYAGPKGLTPERIEAWCKAGLIHRSLVRTDILQGDEVACLSLTMKGGRALEAATGTNLEGIPAGRYRRSSQKRAHDLLVGEVALAVLSLGRDKAIDLLGVETDDTKLGASVVLAEPGRAPERVALQADALVVVTGERGPVALLVEVDRGTTAPGRMRRKYAAYFAWHREGGPLRDFNVKALRVLTVAPDERRLRKLHEVALDANRGKRSGFLLFALQDDCHVVVADRLLEPVASPLGGFPHERVPVLPPGTDTEKRLAA